jgi:DNA mismatch endonuclease (patch repair protein)
MRKRLYTKVPRYTAFQPASEASSRAMRGNRDCGTQPEVLLRRTLWRMGARYRKNVKGICGKPDLVFPRARIVVFCDGDFWHGRKWESLRQKLERRANAAYWVQKIRANRERDRRTRSLLRRAGWRVITLWESDVRRDPSAAAASIMEALRSAATECTVGTSCATGVTRPGFSTPYAND